jgi:hypothetical protein
MALIVEQPKQDTALQNVQQAAGLIGQIAGGFKKQAADAKTAEMDERKLGLLESAGGRAEEKHQVEMDAVQKEQVHEAGVDVLQQERQTWAIEQAGPNATPEEIQTQSFKFRKNPNDANFDPDVTTAEQLLNVENMRGSRDFQLLNAELTKNDATKRHGAIMDHGKKADIAVVGGDWDEAFKQYDEAYTLHRDGSEVVVDANQKGYVLTDSFGKEKHTVFDSKEELAAHFKDQLTLVANEDDYLKKVAADRTALAAENAADIAESGWYNITKGDKKGWTAQVTHRRNMFGTDKRKEKAFVYDGNNNFVKEMTMDEFKKLGMRPIDVAAKDVGIEKTQALTVKAEKEGAAEAKKSRSTEFKLATDLVDSIPAYLQNAGGDMKKAKAEAMRHVMAIKSARDLNSAREFAVKTMGTDFTNKEEAAAFMKLYNSTRSALPSRKTNLPVKPTGLIPGEGGDVDVAQSERKTITRENTSTEQVSNIKKRTQELLKQGKTVPQIKQIILDEQNN